MERSEASWEYAANMIFKTKAVSEREARFKSSDAVLPAIKQAAPVAGVALSRGSAYDRYLTCTIWPAEEEGWYDVDLFVTFKRNKRTWEEDSAWLRAVLEGVSHPEVRFVRLSQFLGRFRA